MNSRVRKSAFALKATTPDQRVAELARIYRKQFGVTFGNETDARKTTKDYVHPFTYHSLGSPSTVKPEHMFGLKLKFDAEVRKLPNGNADVVGVKESILSCLWRAERTEIVCRGIEATMAQGGNALTESYNAVKAAMAMDFVHDVRDHDLRQQMDATVALAEKTVVLAAAARLKLITVVNRVKKEQADRDDMRTPPAVKKKNEPPSLGPRKRRFTRFNGV